MRSDWRSLTDPTDEQLLCDHHWMTPADYDEMPECKLCGIDPVEWIMWRETLLETFMLQRKELVELRKHLNAFCKCPSHGAQHED